MKVALITGAGGLIGSEAVSFMSGHFDKVIGIDNGLRSYFFGENASVEWNINRLKDSYSNYVHHEVDIRNNEDLESIFKEYGNDIKLIIHTAAQPSHDWAAKEPITDFTINANGTLNLLELTRNYSSESVFIFTSTNKVYGDQPNFLPLIEHDTRWEIRESHHYYENGIDESMSVDQTKHSLFGASKLAADVLCQEYGKYFGMKVGVFRGGCLTGPNHTGAQLHGFLAYLMKCAITKTEYTVLGYKGKQVRDNIHAWDLINMFWSFYNNPKKGEVYNAGGGRYSNCSMMEGIAICEEITSNVMKVNYSDENRIGDHIWYISDTSKFQKDFPEWTWRYDLKTTLNQMFVNMKIRY
jgi:CDP-paratose 2-epimerase